MNRLGIIGGLGPMATAYFLQLLIDMTQAETDQEHIDMVIYNTPSIPDRTAYILGKSSDSPLPKMLEIGKKLENEGVSCIAIPCMTAHYFHANLVEQLNTPVIHGIEETAAYLKERNYEAVGVMATDGTVKSGLFSDSLSKYGIKTIYPSEDGQQYVMDIIYGDVKAGRDIEMDKFKKVNTELRSHGAQVIVLGCTELSMVKRDYPLGAGYLDVMDVLARACVKRCGILKESYEELITK